MSANYIHIHTIPHNLQRYNTVGDWEFDSQIQEGELLIRVSDLKNPDYHTLLAVHELIEAKLCQARGITGEVVDQWDLAHLDHPDPGSIPQCPYFREHMFAAMIERAMAAELDVNWDEYEAALEAIT